VLTIANHEVRPRHRGELRVLVAAPRPAGLGQARAYLLADLLRRYAERSGLLPTVVDIAPDGESGLRAACDALNIHPPLHTLTRPPAAGQLAALFRDGAREPVFDLGVRLGGSPGGRTGEGRADGQADERRLAAEWAEVPADAGGVALGNEPLAVRLRLLGFEGDAARALGRWRERVALWARSPSGAMSRPHAAAISAAFRDGLDARTALRVLADLDADESVPEGVKFETFAAADALLGLDLAREVGR
jgi:hypothetical protein